MIDSLQKIVPWLVALSLVPKLLFSFALVLLTVFFLGVIWISPSSGPRGETNIFWPQEHTETALNRRVTQITGKNRIMLGAIFSAIPEAIGTDDLARYCLISHEESIQRAKELKDLDLIDVVDHTNNTYRVATSVSDMLDSHHIKALGAVLQTKVKPVEKTNLP